MRPTILETSILTAILTLGLGCTGELLVGPAPSDDGASDGDEGDEGDGDDTPAEEARQLFDDLREDLVIACGSCHVGTEVDDSGNGPDFFGPTAADAHDALVAYRSYADQSPLVGDSPENSRLYIYGAHDGPAPTQELAAALAQWIEVRAEENGVVDPGPSTGVQPATLVEALTLFGNCMQYADFQITQLAAVATQDTADGGDCASCHSTGTGGAYLSLDPIAFYTNLRQRPYILKFALGTVNTDGSFKDLVPARRWVDKQTDTEHPAYAINPTYVTAMDQFYDLTKARYQTAIDTNAPCVADAPVAP